MEFYLFIYLYIVIVHNVTSLYDQLFKLMYSVNTMEQDFFCGKSV